MRVCKELGHEISKLRRFAYDQTIKDTFEDIELTRAYNQQLVALAKKNPKIVDVEADVGNCIFGPDFQKVFPERYINLGICEQSLSSVSAGMSAVGLIPFCHTFAVFASRRMCDQNYISCAYAKNNVKIIASAPGISSGENGGTHHANEDIALVRPITGIIIMEPADSVAMRWAVKNAAENFGVYYIRAERLKSNMLYKDDSEFAIGKQRPLRGSDVNKSRRLPHVSLPQASELQRKRHSARVSYFTIKPIDGYYRACAKETGHRYGENPSSPPGLAARFRGLCDSFCAVPMKRIGIPNRFGEVGQPAELQEVMHMTDKDIAEAAEKVIAGKKAT